MVDLLSTDDLEFAYYQTLFGAGATAGMTLPDLRYIYFYTAMNGGLPFVESSTINQIVKLTQAEYDALPQPRPADVLYVIPI
jgi:hypothetical protein